MAITWAIMLGLVASKYGAARVISSLACWDPFVCISACTLSAGCVAIMPMSCCPGSAVVVSQVALTVWIGQTWGVCPVANKLDGFCCSNRDGYSVLGHVFAFQIVHVHLFSSWFGQVPSLAFPHVSGCAIRLAVAARMLYDPIFIPVPQSILGELITVVASI